MIGVRCGKAEVVTGNAAGGLRLEIEPTAAKCGRAAAECAAGLIREAVSERGAARVLFASAPSQNAFLATLVSLDLPWPQVDAFHIDEYVGLPLDSPQAFGQWLDERLFSRVPLRGHRIATDGDPLEAARRYGAAVMASPIDVACIGIGVNGHIAFNEPYQWAVEDDEPMRLVELAGSSRQQQVDDGCFARIEDVPSAALTLTVPTLLSARALVVTVPGAHKAEAVAAAVEGDLTPAVPASILRSHARATLFLDRAAASSLSRVTA
jgi:glucosamine-6-phosphate deaminase